MNRQTKRAMAKSGADKPSRPDRRPPSAPRPAREHTGPVQYLSEVRGEMRKVAWPPRKEIINSTIVVIVGLIVMTTLVALFDLGSLWFTNLIYG